MTAPAPIRLPPNPDEIIGTVRTLQDAVEVFRMMKERWGLTFKFMDEVSGLSKGHADKVLSRTAQKRLGYDSFAVFCEMFAIEFEAKINIEAVKRMEAVWEGRLRPPYSPDCKPGRVSKKLIEMAKPHVLKDLAKVGGTASGAMRTGSHGSEIMRKIAKSRWKKTARAARNQIRKGPPAGKVAQKSAVESTLAVGAPSKANPSILS